MPIKLSLLSFLAAAAVIFNCTAAEPSYVVGNRAPLAEKTYLELPLGAIKAEGWLHEMLVRQRDGMTGRLDGLYPQVVGPRNGWLGGDGDQWERGPYWIDGLLPLAYLLGDEALIAKTTPWIEWCLASQGEEGLFGPRIDYAPEAGLQRNNAKDWWPKMVMLKVLQQYYSATGDERVIGFMTRYFRYQLETLPEFPLGHWSFWAEYRACDNMQAVYWLYNRTGDRFLLELAELLHRQGHDFVGMFTRSDDLTRINTIHCVNLAQGIKEPVVYYQQSRDPAHIEAVKTAFADIRKYHGHANGLYGGDEALHGNDPTQGSELCTAVEMMFSLEKMLEITGDVDFADHLEKIAFNALPAQITDNFMERQYFQQANQVMASCHIRNFDVNHHGTDNVFGLLTGYPCCTCNMHQGWPKFTQNLWYATADGGIAALVYSPSKVTARVAGGAEVTVTENTRYPMDGTIEFTVGFSDSRVRSASFPFHLRIPRWCSGAVVTVNGSAADVDASPGTIAVIDRTWKKGDIVRLELPMRVTTAVWKEDAVSVERGPLVYALKIGEQWEKIELKGDLARYGDYCYEVRPSTPWNYGLIDLQNPELMFRTTEIEEKKSAAYPWSAENAPVEIKAWAKRIPHWTLYNESAGPLPFSRSITDRELQDAETEEITLIPYGCTTLRISEFPLIKGRWHWKGIAD